MVMREVYPLVITQSLSEIVDPGGNLVALHTYMCHNIRRIINSEKTPSNGFDRFFISPVSLILAHKQPAVLL